MWNCRGVRKKNTGHFLRHLVASNEVVMIGLVETKVETFGRHEVDRLVGRGWDYFHHPAVGKSGGLLLLWREDIIRFVVTVTTAQCVGGRMVLPSLQQWNVLLIYANKEYHVRRTLWETIDRVQEPSIPTIVGGDFNCCLSQEEKMGGKRFCFSAGAQEMADALARNDLHDLGFSGPKFTWSNNKDAASRIWVRLDRILINSEGLNAAPLATVKHLPRLASDHCPLLLGLGMAAEVPFFKWIRFEDIWMSYPASWRIVHKAWSRNDFGTPAEMANRKCSRTLRSLFFWSRNRIRDLGKQKEQLEERIKALQLIDSSAEGLSREQEDELRLVIGEFSATLARLATWWGQRAKVRWIEEGDANSHFFHSMASARRRSNRINEVKLSDGELTSDPTRIHDVFWQFFSAKWRAREVGVDNWPAFDPAEVLPVQARSTLEAEITEEEIRRAVFSMGNNRSPGLDGITSSFMKFYWIIIKNDVCAAIKDFFATNEMCETWKDTLVILLPKSPAANMPALFRPISLCQTFYKVVAKILVFRLKPFLSDLIGEEQGAFVPGRSISSHGLLAQEVLCKFQHSTKKDGLMAIKVDMEQAYDCMAWDTLQRVMEAMGFPARFIIWILQCTTKPRFSFLLNGNRSNWIPALSGFRQGCPLSPYLFILCSQLLTKAFHCSGRLLGVQLIPNGERVSHLLYADDILIFAEASRANAIMIQSILKSYCLWTGQRVHNTKSAILFNKRCPRWKCRRLAKLLGFRLVESLDYLGLPLVLRKPIASDFSKILKNATDKIHVWGKRHLSLAGRATLIRSALQAVPLYCMTLSGVPRGVLAAIDKIGRQFLWRKDGNSRGMHYVAWDDLCKPVACGGLGFHSSVVWQGPLRARLAWNFLKHPNTLLNRLLIAKYGDNPWVDSTGRNTSVSWRIIQDGASSLRPILRWSVGNGSCIDVFKDVWILDKRLDLWPTFFCRDAEEPCSVSQFLDGSHGWNRRAVFQTFGEVLGARIIEIPVGGELEKDVPELVRASRGTTVTALAYAAKVGEEGYCFGWIRLLRLHPRERMFWWRLLRDAIPTNVWLARRNLSDTDLCPWGCGVEEDRAHCTVHCLKLKQVLACLADWGIRTPVHDAFEDMICSLKGMARDNPPLGRIFCYAVYQSWRARNAFKHGRAFGTPKVIAATVLSQIPKSFCLPNLEQWCINQPIGLPASRLWCTPPPNWLKVNFDAALCSSNRAGLGLVVRDDLGRLIIAVGRMFEHWDPLQAELKAALAFAEIIEDWMYDREGLIVEGDSAEVVKWLQETYQPASRLHRIVDGPDLSFLCNFRQVIFQHIPRLSNRPADFCAKHALLCDFTWIDVNSSLIPLSFVELLREESDRIS
ncbi:Putative ribonuclease H protein [Dendrobium catenatum]|uniref:Ribonuclease H protein n=1 Tax=Dendrobium catenatum TaxID=906689 RepID=A0A2I0W5R2_9ASPA|nr:Putative ribonuclease H protein [Dendrobium catenatum]